MLEIIFFLFNCIYDSSNLLPNERLIENQSGNINLISCNFLRTTKYFSQHGSIIYINQQLCNLFINLCLFYNCTTNSGSGAIYFFSQIFGSKISILNTCCHKCSGGGSDHGHFALIYMKNDINYPIYISQLSINNSPFADDPGSDVFWLNYGNHSINNLNSSNNPAQERSGLTISFSNILSINFCTFINNNPQKYCVLWFQGGNSDKSLQFSNIINSSSIFSHGVVWISNVGNHIFDSCIFYNNLNILFYIESNLLTIKNCKISHKIDKIIYGNINSQFQNIITINIKHPTINNFHFSTYFCFNDIILSSNENKRNEKLLKFSLIVAFLEVN